MNTKSESHSSKLKKGSSPPPPPPMPPLPKFSSLVKPAVKRETAVSVTKREIARYWRQKSKVEEDHLLAAIKAAAHIRLRNLLMGDSRLLEEFLAQDDDTTDDENLDGLFSTSKFGAERYMEKSESTILLANMEGKRGWLLLKKKEQSHLRGSKLERRFRKFGAFN